LSAFPGTDRFSIRRRLGSGGSGVVYEAFDEERQALVALKVPHDSGTREISRFKQEFRALAEISHPNLVNLYEVMSHGPEWFFTMERVEGRTFTDFLCPDRWPPKDYDQVRALLRQLAEGLWSLHQTGRLHQDLKPSHVLVEPGGRVVFLDFGFTADRVVRGPEVDHQIEGGLGRTGQPVGEFGGQVEALGRRVEEVLTADRPPRVTERPAPAVGADEEEGVQPVVGQGGVAGRHPGPHRRLDGGPLPDV